MTENPAVALMLALAMIILASRIGGAIARQFKQPRVLGELIIGVLLGPTLLNFLHWDVFHGIELEGVIKELAELGVVVLMFLIGLEVNLKELRDVGRVGIIAGVLGVAVPIAMTYGLMIFFDYEWQLMLFAGVTLAATSVSISAQVLFELGVLKSKEGSALLATAIIDDILAILLVSLVVAITAGNNAEGTEASFASFLPIILRMFGFLLIASLIAWFALPPMMNWLSNRASFAQSYGVPALAIVLLLFFAWSAEFFGGVATITGSFIAGIGLSQTRHQVKHSIEESVSYIAYAFLVPIFFVDIGLETDLSVFPLDALPFASLLLLVAIVSKVGGCGIGAKLGGFNNQESLRLGVCMISRGEVGLIVASIGLANGIFQQGSVLFASLFLVILLSTLVTPILVRWVFRDVMGQAKSSMVENKA